MFEHKPICQAHFKCHATDFVVTEIMDTNHHDQQGEHWWLYIQKTGINTAYLAKLLAHWANISPSCVHYSGRKDRHAQTSQWFSLHIPSLKKQQSLNIDQLIKFTQRHLKPFEQIQILQHHYHSKKLHKGTHSHNDFNIILRHVHYRHLVNFHDYMTNILHVGMPNFFGRQRFGKNNLAKFYKLAKKHRQYHKIKPTDFLLISSARSYLFNEILHQRMQENTWHQAILGDVLMQANSSLVLFAEENICDDIIHRMQMGEIHPTGLLYGKSTNIQSKYEAYRIERLVLDNHQELCQALLSFDIKATQRSLRIIPSCVNYKQEDDTLTLQFRLPTGAFATSFLSILVDNLVDISSDKIDWHDVIDD